MVHYATFSDDDGRFLALQPGPWTAVGLNFPNKRRHPVPWRAKVNVWTLSNFYYIRRYHRHFIRQLAGDGQRPKVLDTSSSTPPLIYYHSLLCWQNLPFLLLKGTLSQKKRLFLMALKVEICFCSKVKMYLRIDY